jgi:hypothetical protein
MALSCRKIASLAGLVANRIDGTIIAQHQHIPGLLNLPRKCAWWIRDLETWRGREAHLIRYMWKNYIICRVTVLRSFSPYLGSFWPNMWAIFNVCCDSQNLIHSFSLVLQIPGVYSIKAPVCKATMSKKLSDHSTHSLAASLSIWASPKLMAFWHLLRSFQAFPLAHPLPHPRHLQILTPGRLPIALSMCSCGIKFFPDTPEEAAPEIAKKRKKEGTNAHVH